MYIVEVYVSYSYLIDLLVSLFCQLLFPRSGMFKHNKIQFFYQMFIFVVMNKIDAKIKKSNIITFGSQISPVFVCN